MVCKHQPVPLARVDLWLLGNRVYTRLSWICNTDEQTAHAQLKALLTYGSRYNYQVLYSSLLCGRKRRTKTEFQIEIWSTWVGSSLALAYIPEVGLLEVRLSSVTECAREVWAVGYTSLSCWCSWGELFFLVSCRAVLCRAVFFVLWVNGDFSFWIQDSRRYKGKYFLTVLWFVSRHIGCWFSFQYIKATVWTTIQTEIPPTTNH